MAKPNTSPMLTMDQLKTGQAGLGDPNTDVGRENLATAAQAATALPKMSTMNPAIEPAAIPVDTIKPRNAIDLKATLPTLDPSAANATVAGSEFVKNDIQKYLDKLETPKTALGGKETALVDELYDLYGTDGVGRAKAMDSAEEKFGVKDIRNQMTELNSQLNMRTAQYDKMFADQELQPGQLASLVSGRQLAVRRTQAADIGLINARILATKGQYDSAMDAAEAAVDLKFASDEENIAAKLKQLEVITPLLDEEKAKTAEAQKLMLEEEKVKVTEQKAKAKTNIDLAFSVNANTKFANRGGEFFRVSDGKTYDSMEEFFKDAGVTSFADAYQRGLITDITQEMVADKDFVLQLRNKYPDAGINFNDSAQAAVTKLGDSWAYASENSDINGADPGDTTTGPEITKIGDESFVWDPTSQSFLPAESLTDTYNEEPEPSGMQLQALNSVNDIFKKYLDPKKGFTALGGNRITQLYKIQGTDGWNLNNEINTLKARLEMDNAKLIKGQGAISDGEREMLSRASSKLAAGQGPEEFEKTLREIKAVIDGNIERYKQGQSQDFKQVGNTSASGIVKGSKPESAQKMALLNPDGSPQTSKGPSLAGSVINRYKPGAVGGQCGVYARKVVSNMGMTYPALGNSLGEKLNAVKKYGVPAQSAGIGSVIVTRENPTWGHVAVILQKVKGGVIVSESNFKAKERVSHGRFVPYSKIVGAINPRKA